MTDTIPNAPRPTGTPDPATPLSKLAARFWSGYLHDHPTFATSIGERAHDHRLEDPSNEGRAAERGRLAALREEIRALPADELGQRDRISYSALDTEIATAIAIIDSGLERWTVDPLEGVPVGLLNLVQYQPAETIEQGDAMVERWRQIGPYVDATIANLRESLDEGLVAARAPVDRVIDVLDETLRGDDEEWSLLEPARADHHDWPAAARERFRTDLRRAVEERVRPAFERYRATLVDAIAPAARPDATAGVGHLAGGDVAYAAMVRVHTSLDLTAAELHETGLREVDRIRAELADLGRRALGTSGVAATVGRLRRDPSLYFSTGEEVQTAAETALARAKAAVPTFFGRLPRTDCVVVPIPSYEAEHSTLGYYLWPSIDGSRPGRYYINLAHPETRPRYEAEALAFHESVPGHHLQIAIGQELDGIPEFRRHLGSTAFFEGWGLYTERLADEMGLYSSDMDRFGILSFDAWRACRLVVDTGIHVFGWSRERAIQYMVENTALAENNIANEVDRYIVWPGQAVAYKTGQLELLRLRADSERRLGARFDIRTFHDVVLGNGAVGLTTLREVVDAWSGGPLA